MSILDKIINISKKIVEEKYAEHLNVSKKLKLSESELHKILIDSFNTNNNWKDLIRNELKKELENEYPKSSVENILLEIHQDKKKYIDLIKDEIISQQNNNTLELELKIINDSLNINIELNDNYVVIKNVNKNIYENEIYEKINKYKFIYKINNIILEEYDNDTKIKKLKENIINKEKVKITLYYLKN
tara:strand:- start:979 stop:1542 length:564 start_codon:yes stop_codon:yes gene_type:complete